MRGAIALVTLTVGLAAPSAATAAEAEPPKPTVAPAVEKPSRQVTKCWQLCALRDWLEGDDENVTVAFRQTDADGNVTISSAEALMQGDRRGGVKVVDATAHRNPERVVMATDELDTPDHYAGTLTVDPSTDAPPVAVPLAVDVREGPEVALLLLLGSLAVGWALAKIIGARPRVAFRASALELKDRIQAMPASERGVLMPLWEDTWKARVTEFGTAQTHMAALGSGAEALRRARDLEDDALRSHNALLLVPWVQRIRAAITKLIAKVREYAEDYAGQLAEVKATTEQLAAAEAALTTLSELSARAKPAGQGSEKRAFEAAAQELDNALAKVSTDPAEATPELEPLLAALQERFAALERAHRRPLEGVPGAAVPAGAGDAAAQAAAALGWPVPPDSSRLQALRFDIGTGLARALLPIAGLAALLVLLAVGFKVTYLDNKTFGATGADYLAMVLWGLAAYGTREALTGIGKAPAEA